MSPVERGYMESCWNSFVPVESHPVDVHARDGVTNAFEPYLKHHMV